MTPSREQLLHAAAVLDMARSDHSAVVEYLRQQAGNDLPAHWRYLGGYSNTLWAADPGRNPLPFRDPPGFTFHVAELFAAPGHLVDVSGPLRPGEVALRANVHAERKRLAKRLADRRQGILAAAIAGDIHLEQAGRRVVAVYEPERDLILLDG